MTEEKNPTLPTPRPPRPPPSSPLLLFSCFLFRHFVLLSRVRLRSYLLSVVVLALSPNPVGMGLPAVGGILYSQRNEGNLKLSQKLIHTRVYGQMTVVSMVVRLSLSLSLSLSLAGGRHLSICIRWFLRH